ncbi:MAG: L,D-transpeptidase family protein, partial [Chthoniobacterales bacterium]
MLRSSKIGSAFSLLVIGLPLVSFTVRAQEPAAAAPVPEVRNEVIVSVKDQKLMLLQNGAKVTTYPVSTSKFGIGDDWGRMTTPVGAMAVAQKIGDHAPQGAVFHNRRYTGEILRPNAPGRDPIVTRIIWLRGLEPTTAHAFARCIYIHGTAEERTIGRPASYGCIRMKSTDVTA